MRRKILFAGIALVLFIALIGSMKDKVKNIAEGGTTTQPVAGKPYARAQPQPRVVHEGPVLQPQAVVVEQVLSKEPFTFDTKGCEFKVGVKRGSRTKYDISVDGDPYITVTNGIGLDAFLGHGVRTVSFKLSDGETGYARFTGVILKP